MKDLQRILRLFLDGGVELIVIGGVAAVAHGSARTTEDVDFVYRRTPENIRRLADVLAPYHPYLRGRGVPPGLPFQWDTQTIQRGLNFTLTTDVGFVDLLGEVAGGGTYEDILPHSVHAVAFGIECQCVDLPTLIRMKRAAGRPKDFEAIAELELLLEDSDGVEQP
jgi:hypothetical protein